MQAHAARTLTMARTDDKVCSEHHQSWARHAINCLEGGSTIVVLFCAGFRLLLVARCVASGSALAESVLELGDSFKNSLSFVLHTPLCGLPTYNGCLRMPGRVLRRFEIVPADLCLCML